MSITVTGLDETIQYIGRLKETIPAAIAKGIHSDQTLEGMTQDARRIVESVVYAVYSPTDYKRTMDLLFSVNAVKISDSPPSSGLMLDLTSDTAADHGRGDVNYAIFMLPEFADKSWLSRTVPSTLPRDFLTVWLQFFADQIPLKVADAIQEALND